MRALPAELPSSGRAPGWSRVTGIEARIPASQSGEFVNNLVPRVELYDDAGNQVATRDGEGRLRYKVPKKAGGTYFVVVDGFVGNNGAVQVFHQLGGDGAAQNEKTLDVEEKFLFICYLVHDISRFQKGWLDSLIAA